MKITIEVCDKEGGGADVSVYKSSNTESPAITTTDAERLVVTMLNIMEKIKGSINESNA